MIAPRIEPNLNRKRRPTQSNITAFGDIRFK